MQNFAGVLRCDLRGFNKWAKDVVQKQVPFATARALTSIARQSQEEVLQGLPKHFRVRSQWVARGVQFKRAEKRDYPHCFATVGSRDKFMLLQETGGTKRPPGSHRLTVPTKAIAAQAGALGVPKRLRPKKLLGGNKPRAFESARGNVLVRPGTAFGPQQPPKVAWFLRSKVDVKPRWGFVSGVTATARKSYGNAFVKALTEAITTPKKPAVAKLPT